MFIVIAGMRSSTSWVYLLRLISSLVACGAVSAVGIPLLQETYGPVIRLRRAAKSGDPEKAATLHPHLQQEHSSKLHILWVNLERPFEMLFRSSVCFILSLYMAL